MNDRQRNLLKILLVSPDKFFQVKELRGLLDCSDKTVRTDLNRLEQFLTSYPEVRLVRKRSIGIKLQVPEKVKGDIYDKINRISTKTEEERLIEIAYHLLIQAKPVTLKEFEEKYFTNAADIKRDFEKINKWFAQFDLYIETRQRVGSIVIGEEFHKRNALAHLSELVSANQERNYVLDFFPEYEIKAVKKVIQDTQLEYDLDLTDGRFESLMIHALIMIKRTRQKTPVIIADEDMRKTTSSKEYEITTELLERLESILRLTFPYNERIYYAWHISSALPMTKMIMDFSENNKMLDSFPSQLVRRIIQKVAHDTQIPFLKDDMLMDGLVIHMDAVVKRISYGFHITNPMLNEIKKLYPYLFSMIVFSLNEIGEEYKVHIPEEEAAYLVLHFQASIERMEEKQQPKRVLVVCHMGIGMSRLLQAKLEQQYKGLTIVGCIAKNEMQQFLKTSSEIDFIITTVSLSKIDIPYVVISPLLDEKDKVKINQFIQEGKSELLEGTYSTLRYFISNGLFQRDVDLEHPFQVVERLSNQLVRLAVVDETFTHSALLRERASFTAVGGKIAIPHAEPSTVKRSTVSMAILKEPLNWGNELVSVVFLLAISEEDRHLTRYLLKEISQLSDAPELIEKIIYADKKEDVIQVLQ